MLKRPCGIDFVELFKCTEIVDTSSRSWLPLRLPAVRCGVQGWLRCLNFRNAVRRPPTAADLEVRGREDDLHDQRNHVIYDAVVLQRNLVGVFL